MFGSMDFEVLELQFCTKYYMHILVMESPKPVNKNLMNMKS